MRANKSALCWKVSGAGFCVEREWVLVSFIKANNRSTTEAIQNAEYPTPTARAMTTVAANAIHIQLARSDSIDEIVDCELEYGRVARAAKTPQAMPPKRATGPMCTSVSNDRPSLTQRWHASVQNANPKTAQIMMRTQRNGKSFWLDPIAVFCPFCFTSRKSTIMAG